MSLPVGSESATTVDILSTSTHENLATTKNVAELANGSFNNSFTPLVHKPTSSLSEQEISSTKPEEDTDILSLYNVKNQAEDDIEPDLLDYEDEYNIENTVHESFDEIPPESEQAIETDTVQFNPPITEKEEPFTPASTTDEIAILDSSEEDEEEILQEEEQEMINSESNPILIEEEEEAEEEEEEEQQQQNLSAHSKPLRIPIILKTNNFPYLLTPIPDDLLTTLPTEYEHAIILFEEEADHDKGEEEEEEEENTATQDIYSLTLYELFQFIRETFKDYGNAFPEDEELVIHFKEFDLTLPESDTAGYKVILQEVVEAFVGLREYLETQVNETNSIPVCLCLELTLRKGFISELEKLRKLGKRRESALTDVPALAQLRENHELEKITKESDAEDLLEVLDKNIMVSVENSLSDINQQVDHNGEDELLEEIDDDDDAIQELDDTSDLDTNKAINTVTIDLELEDNVHVDRVFNDPEPLTIKNIDVQQSHKLVPDQQLQNSSKPTTFSTQNAEEGEDDLLEYVNSPATFQSLDTYDDTLIDHQTSITKCDITDSTRGVSKRGLELTDEINGEVSEQTAEIEQEVNDMPHTKRQKIDE